METALNFNIIKLVFCGKILYLLFVFFLFFKSQFLLNFISLFLVFFISMFSNSILLWCQAKSKTRMKRWTTSVICTLKKLQAAKNETKNGSKFTNTLPVQPTLTTSARSSTMSRKRSSSRNCSLTVCFKIMRGFIWTASWKDK